MIVAALGVKMERWNAARSSRVIDSTVAGVPSDGRP